MNSLKVHEKQTASSRGKQVRTASDQERSPDQIAMENRHQLGWFARPEKFTKDRPNTNSQNRSQRGMNRSGVRSNSNNGETGQGQSSNLAQARLSQDNGDVNMQIYNDNEDIMGGGLGEKGHIIESPDARNNELVHSYGSGSKPSAREH